MDQEPKSFINPWHDPRNQYSRETYNIFPGRVETAEHMGIKVYQYHEHSFIFTYNGAAITERAGWSKYKEVIEDILTNPDSFERSAKALPYLESHPNFVKAK